MTKEEEIWMPIIESSFHEISSLGRLKNGKTGRILKPFLNKEGYIQYAISANGKQCTLLAHRLIGQAFIQNPENKAWINHIDGNKLNNSLSNLEWCTPQYNIQHAFKNGLNKIPNGIGHSSSKPIDKICKNTGQIIESFESANLAGKVGYNVANITRCARGLRVTADGFIWRYKS